MDPHAQTEIRKFAKIIGEEIVAKWCPISWEAFLDYRMDCTLLTRLEKDIVRAINGGESQEAESLARSFGWLEMGKSGLKRSRERSEFEEKAKDLGISLPWIP